MALTIKTQLPDGKTKNIILTEEAGNQSFWNKGLSGNQKAIDDWLDQERLRVGYENFDRSSALNKLNTYINKYQGKTYKGNDGKKYFKDQNGNMYEIGNSYKSNPNDFPLQIERSNDMWGNPTINKDYQNPPKFLYDLIPIITDIKSSDQGGKQKTTPEFPLGKSNKTSNIPLSQLPDEYKQLRMAMVTGKNPNVNIRLPQASTQEGSYGNTALKGLSEGLLNVLGEKVSSETGKYKFDKQIVPQLEQTYGLRFQNLQPELEQAQKNELNANPIDKYFGLSKGYTQSIKDQMAQQPNGIDNQYSSARLMPNQTNSLAYNQALEEMGIKIKAQEIRNSVEMQNWLDQQVFNRRLSQAEAMSAKSTGDALLSMFATPNANTTTNTIAK